jgi:hypothetical protein
VIEPAAGCDPIAWFPVALENITTHPSGCRWAGSVGSHLYLIQLEGDRLCGNLHDANATQMHSAPARRQDD